MQFNKYLNDIHTYEAGKPIELLIRKYGIKEKDIIKLASNENPYGTSPKVIFKIYAFAKNMFRYPDDSMYELKEALARKFYVHNSNILVGAGSDQLIDLCVRAKCNESSKILMAKTTFSMYEICAKQTNAKVLKTKDHTHNLEQLYSLYKKYGADLIFLCLPNNPLGEALDKKEVYTFLRKIDKNTLVVIDGVYQEFASFKDKRKQIIPKHLINKFSNCIYLGSFSKAYGLGGMRVGFAIAKKSIIKKLYKLRIPFNVSSLSLIAANEALKDEEFVTESIQKNFLEMKRYEEFAEKRGINYINSYTNFITLNLDNKYDSSKIVDELLLKGIIIRDLSSYGVNSIRITIGTNKENTIVLDQLEKLFQYY